MSDLQDRLSAALGDRYVIRRELSGGGLSRVFLADEIAPPRRIVLKVLPPELGSVVGSQRFNREIEVVARLQHPNIVPLLETGMAHGIPFYTMPYVEGETLRARLAKDPRRPITEVIRLFREVADALAYAHAHGVVHRDIKPENILMSAGHACVADFGIAKALSAAGDATITTAGLAVGTPAYMAPEQALGDPDANHRVDLYALGAVAFEMLAGAPPFTGANAAQIIAAQTTRAPRPINELRGDCPVGLAAIVMHCLEKDPQSRPQQAAEIIGWLDAIGTPGALKATSGRPRIRRRVVVAASAYFHGDDSSEYAHLERAAALDTTYTTPLVFLAFARAYNFDYATADTVVRHAERLSARLAPAERALLDHVEAVIAANTEEALRTAQRFMTLMPGSQESPLLLASAALSTLKPGLALRALARVDPDRGLNLAGPFYWLYESEAAAQVGNWDRALAMGRAGQRRFPESRGMCYSTSRALARLGRIAELEHEVAAVPSRGDPLVAQARLAVNMWGELRAAGHPDAADRLMQRYATLLDDRRDDTARDAQFYRGRVLVRAGRASESREIFATLATRDTGYERLKDLNELGVAEATLGHRDAALNVEHELSSLRPRYDRGSPILFQAEIAANLGDRDRAIVLLQQALTRGVGLQELGAGIFGNANLAPLYGYPPFERMLRPDESR